MINISNSNLDTMINGSQLIFSQWALVFGLAIFCFIFLIVVLVLKNILKR